LPKGLLSDKQNLSSGGYFSSAHKISRGESTRVRGGQSHFFRLRFRSSFQNFESGSGSGSGNFFNLKIRLQFRLRCLAKFMTYYCMSVILLLTVKE